MVFAKFVVLRNFKFANIARVAGPTAVGYESAVTVTFVATADYPKYRNPGAVKVCLRLTRRERQRA